MPDVNIKKSIEYKFWTRPTISWNPNCDLKKETNKSAIVDAFKGSEEKLEKPNVLAYFIINLVIFGLGFILIWGFLLGKNPVLIIVITACGMLIMIILFFVFYPQITQSIKFFDS